MYDLLETHAVELEAQLDDVEHDARMAGLEIAPAQVCTRLVQSWQYLCIVPVCVRVRDGGEGRVGVADWRWRQRAEGSSAR